MLNLGCVRNFVANADDGLSQVDENGRFVDNSHNRRYFINSYKDLIAKELSGRFPDLNWQETWRRSIRVIEENHDNPEWVKATVRQMRRDAGLPVWSFLY